MSLYLDASAIVPSLVAERSSQVLGEFLEAATDPLAISDFAAAEVASAFSRLVRIGTMPRQVADNLLSEFDAWRASVTIVVELASADIRLANVFVRRFDLGLRAPDAIHAAACLRGDHTLVTLDRRLASAAEALGVRVTCPA